MTIKTKQAIKAACFLLLLSFFLIMLNDFFQPKWSEWNNYSTTHGFYKEPRDTIETLFLGSSVIVNGIIPTQLYQEYGICSYNLATEMQPMLASYYWLREAYRLHGKSLRTVVLDPAFLFRTPEKEYYQKALDNMAFSENRMEAIRAYWKDEKESFERAIPLLGYHSRWSSLTQADFSLPTLAVWNRGYNPQFDRTLKRAGLFPEYYYDSEVRAYSAKDEGLEYFKRIVEFCKDKDLQLLLIKTPAVTGSWSDALHKAVSSTINDLAPDSIPFVDLNYFPEIEELGFAPFLDLYDSLHLNYYGAHKLTHYIGQYLTEHYPCRDVRGDEKYEFLARQAERFQEETAFILSLKSAKNILDYLETAMNYEHQLILLSVYKEASYELTGQMRYRLLTLGLDKLSKLNYREPYLAVIQDGKLVLELKDVRRDGAKTPVPVLEYDGETILHERYQVKSGGAWPGISSIQIGGEEYSPSRRGINVVVYDYEKRCISDIATFDTYASSERLNLEQELALFHDDVLSYDQLSPLSQDAVLYDRGYDNYKFEYYWELYCNQSQFFQYLSHYTENPAYTVFISVQDEAAGTFDENTRSAFRRHGLATLAGLRPRDSYIGIIDKGKVLYEQRDHSEKPLEAEAFDYRLVSGGSESGNCSAVMIDGTDYSPHGRGLNVVVYDQLLQEVVGKRSFDTSATALLLPDSDAQGGDAA